MEKINNEKEYNEYLKIVEVLMDSEKKENLDRLSELAKLVEEYEDVHYPL